MNLDEYLNSPLPFEEVLRRALGGGDELVIFDIGACEGEDSIRLAKAFPRAVIHSFEPLLPNVERMRRNLRAYAPQLTNVHAFALSDVDGCAELYVSSGRPEDVDPIETWDYGNKSSSLLPPGRLLSDHHPWLRFDEKITVPTMRLDTFCREHEIAKVDFVYLDVQGAELRVLGGAGKTLDTVRAVWLEVEAVELYEHQPLASDVDRFMRAHGFVVSIDDVDDVSGDRLYVRHGIGAPGRSDIPPVQRQVL